ncbi:MAG: glycosyltransferase family 9 protein [Flavobacteriales bacterium]
MGDIILTSSVVRCLKEQLNCEIDFLVKEVFSSLVSENPHVNQTHIFKKPVQNHIATLKSQNYDIILDLQKNRKSKILANALNAEYITFHKLNIKKWILVQSRINLLPKKHIVDRYFDTVEKLGVYNDNKGNEIFIDADTKSSVEMFDLPSNYMTIAVGAQHRGKTMSTVQLKHVISRSSVPVVLLGGSAETALAMELELSLSRTNLINLSGQTSILQLAEIIRRSKLLLSGDTGAMHMASAFKVPQVSVWGCTTPNLGMWPYLCHEKSILIEPYDHSHRPCSKLGNRCKYAPNWCIESVDPELISDGVSAILSEQGF